MCFNNKRKNHIAPEFIPAPDEISIAPDFNPVPDEISIAPDFNPMPDENVLHNLSPEPKTTNNNCSQHTNQICQ
jgi:hypothetical protein